MIIFKKLRYKNFLSTGNKQIEIDLWHKESAKREEPEENEEFSK